MFQGSVRSKRGKLKKKGYISHLARVKRYDILEQTKRLHLKIARICSDFLFVLFDETITTKTGPLQHPARSLCHYDMQTSSSFQFIVRMFTIHGYLPSYLAARYKVRLCRGQARHSMFACLGDKYTWRWNMQRRQHEFDMWFPYIIRKVAWVVGQVIDPVFAPSTAGASSAHPKLGLNNGLT